MKQHIKNILLVTTGLLLMVAFTLTGCGSKTEDITAEELLTNTVTAMAKVKSYQMGYDMSLAMDVVGGENPMKLTMDADGTGAMDVLNQRMQTNMDADVEMPGTGTSKATVTMSMAMYMVDGWLYTNINVPGSGEQWTKAEVPDVASQNQAAQLIALVESASTSTLIGTEKIDGINCHILEIVPDMAAMWQWLMSQQGEFMGDVDLSQFDLSKVITDFGAKYWISRDNYQIIKVEANLTIDMDAETFGIQTDEFSSMSMTMNMSMTFSDYDRSVTIELPVEAVNAEEIDAY